MYSGAQAEREGERDEQHRRAEDRGELEEVEGEVREDRDEFLFFSGTGPGP